MRPVPVFRAPLPRIAPLVALSVFAALVACGATAPVVGTHAVSPSDPAASASSPAAVAPSSSASVSVTPETEPCADTPNAVANDDKTTPSEDATDTLDDGFEAPASDGATAAVTPVDALSDVELEAKLKSDPSSLGTMSLGGIHSGALLYGAQMPTGPRWELVNPAHAGGARETVDALTRCIDKVNTQFSDTPKIFIGDLSPKNGGHFPPHVSHQSGRDVDISYYLTKDHRWYQTANASNLDLPRTWAFVRALVTESDLELLLMDIRVQKLVKQYAQSIGEDAAWLDDVFQYGNKSKRPLVFHVPGHASHLHIRFYAAASRELGRRSYPFLLKRHLIKPPSHYVEHVATKGETLAHMAQRYRTSVDAIKKANHMPNSIVVRGKTYRIPKSGGIERLTAKIAIPPRRTPPAKAIAATPRDTIRDNPCKRATR
jgi:penicillin-insensitive murein endopeptidase